MSFGEVFRAFDSYNRIIKVKQREQATFDYVLADLVGRSVSRIHHSANKMPEIYAAYPALFDAEDIQKQRQQKQAELSAARFRQFANSHNKKFQEVGENK